jgi:archaellum biogenesis protein FlaJ (TadC family)
MGYGFSCFQVYMDLSKPKLGWDNPSRGLKNSASIYMTMLLSLAVIVVLVVVYILLIQIPSPAVPYIYWTLVFAAGIGLCVLMRAMLMHGATKKIEAIES